MSDNEHTGTVTNVPDGDAAAVDNARSGDVAHEPEETLELSGQSNVYVENASDCGGQTEPERDVTPVWTSSETVAKSDNLMVICGLCGTTVDERTVPSADTNETPSEGSSVPWRHKTGILRTSVSVVGLGCEGCGDANTSASSTAEVSPENDGQGNSLCLNLSDRRNRSHRRVRFVKTTRRTTSKARESQRAKRVHQSRDNRNCKHHHKRRRRS